MPTRNKKNRYGNGARNGKNITWGTLKIIIWQTIAYKKDLTEGCHEENHRVTKSWGELLLQRGFKEVMKIWDTLMQMLQWFNSVFLLFMLVFN